MVLHLLLPSISVSVLSPQLPLAMLAVGMEAPVWDLLILLGPPVTPLWRREEKASLPCHLEYVISLSLGPLHKKCSFLSCKLGAEAVCT